MNNRFRRYLGTFFTVAVLGGCALPSTQTNTASAVPANAAGAPLGFEAANKTLANAEPIDPKIPDISNFKQTGRASWYGKRFAGRRTASGERFDMNAMTAAHKTLPLASYVRVTNTSNQQSVIVRVNDRGPYVRGRVIDLSYAAGRKLGLQHAGTARVRIEGLTPQEAMAARAELVADANVPKASQP